MANLFQGYMKETTLKEIATKLGISITTVSKALKNYSDVSPKTKQAVVELAEKLKFKPNSFAVNLRSQESKIIGLIVPEITHDFFSNVIKGIVSEAAKHQYLVVVLESNNLLSAEALQVELLLTKKVDGIIISISDETNNDPHLEAILSKNIPLVQFDKISKLIPSSKIIINDQKAAGYAVQHLIDLGCKKIAHIRGPANPQNAIDRFLGYKKTLEKNNISFDASLVYTCEQVSFLEGFEFAKEIVENHPDVDGIFVITDLVAAGVLMFFNEHQKQKLKNIAIIGFGNWFISQVIEPKLSTIAQPDIEMGKAAFSLLLEEINAKKEKIAFTPKIIELETSLLSRESTLKKQYSVANPQI
jgi:LacI family transcriptional regulator